MLTEYGNGITADCVGCRIPLTIDTATMDRFPIPGKWGGTYRRGNVRPMCVDCNTRHVNEPGSESLAMGLTYRLDFGKLISA